MECPMAGRDSGKGPQGYDEMVAQGKVFEELGGSSV